jgi:ACT domain-containing protein
MTTITNNLVRIEGHSGLKKDVGSGAVVNLDKEGYYRTIVAKRRAEQINQRIIDLESSIKDIHGMLSDICTSLNDRP